LKNEDCQATYTRGASEVKHAIRPGSRGCGTVRQEAQDNGCGDCGNAYNARMGTTWLRQSGAVAILAVHAVPRAAADAVQGLHGDALKIRLNAPPVDGKANEALISFLAGKLRVSKSSMVLKSGFSQRRKIVAVSGLPTAEIQKRLLGQGQGGTTL